MRKKLICLLLCLTVILPVMLSGCGETTDDTGTEEESSARAAVSVNMWLITEKAVSAETEAQIEDAFNEITQAKFTTKVDLVFLTEDEYYDALDEKLAAVAEYKANNADIGSIVLPGMEETTAETEATTAETVVNELGQRLLKYPDIGENQLDIVFIAGKDRLTKYADEGKLSSLETNLNATSKVLKDYIFPSFLEQIVYNKNTYAIPNNHLIGEYTYLLINKELADKYYIDTSKISTLIDCKDLIEEIGNKEYGVAPVLSYVDPVNIHYWLGDAMSLLVSYVPSAATIGSRTIMRSAFETSGFTDHMLLMQECADKGWFAASPDITEDFGVGVVKGGYGLREQYADKYEVKVLTYPVLEEETAYESMFAVSAYSVNLDRAMEVITLINTDSEAKNLLQYGIKGVNYDIDDNGNLVYLNDSYRMNNMYTGNMFISYPEPGMDADVWTDAKAANRDSKVSPYFGLSDVWGEVNPEFITRLSETSETYIGRMKDCRSKAQLAAFFENAKTELNTDEIFKAAFSVDDESTSPYAVYSRWFEKLWPSAE